MNVLRKMKTYENICYGRYIPIRNVAIKFCCVSKHPLKSNQSLKTNVSIDRKINNIKHECFTKNKNLLSLMLRKIHPNQKRLY